MRRSGDVFILRGGRCDPAKTMLERQMARAIDGVTVKTLDDKVVALADVVAGKPVVLSFLRHFG